MTDQTCGVVAALDAEIIGEENAGYSAAHLKDIRDRVAELIAADVEYDAAEKLLDAANQAWEWRSPRSDYDLLRENVNVAQRVYREAYKRRAAALAACKGGA